MLWTLGITLQKIFVEIAKQLGKKFTLLLNKENLCLTDYLKYFR